MKRGAVLIVSMLAAACRSPTQITFEITTDEKCADIQSTTLTAGPLAALTDDRPPTATAPKCTSEGHLGSLVVLPSGDDGDQVAVKVVTGVTVPPDQCGAHGEGCIVAKRALRFVPHTSLTVKVGMDAKCVAIECPGAETCVDGVCRSALIDDPTTCEGAGCDDTTLGGVDGGASIGDGGPAIDATLPNDASSDAPSDASSDAPVSPTEGGSVTPLSIAIGLNFGCALLPDHTVECWGSNAWGELANGAEDASSYAPTPVRVAGLDHVARLAVGEEHGCVVFDDGGVSCWGYSGYGQTGTNDSTDDLVPTHVPGIDPIGLLTAGEYETCAASVDGHKIWCWGIYLAEYDGTDVPTRVPAVDAGIIEMSGGRGVTCGRFDDGLVRCWGQNGDGLLGQGPGSDFDASSTVPLVVGGLSNTRQLCAGYAHVCVVSSTHGVRCWGENDNGQLGPVDPDAGLFSPTPLPLAVDPHVTKVVCGQATACILYDDAGTLCWGYDGEDELGVADVPGSVFATPIEIPNLGPASDIFAGGQSQCAILVDGGVACWGNDSQRQLGAGAQVPDLPIGAFPVTF